MHPNLTLARALAVALSLATAAAVAQSAPAGAGSTGNFPVITVPPPPMTSVANPPTPGADSTLWSNGIPGPQNSSVTIPLPGGGSQNPPPPPPPPITCTPSSFTQSAGASCPAGDTVGGVAGGQTTFTQTRTVTTTCPAGSYGAPVTTATAWTPPASSACLPAGSIGSTGETCSVSCPVTCRISVGGFQRTATQYWGYGGGSACPAGGTPTGQFNTNYTAGSTTPACSGNQTYSYTITSGSCPVTGGGGTGGCTLAEVQQGTCTTCSYNCGNSESGTSCALHNIYATNCSYWSYSGSSCPAGATGGTWRAGLCP